MLNIKHILNYIIRQILFLACSFAVTVQALEIVKDNNANNLNLTTSWVGGNVPTASDVAVWNSTVVGANTTSQGGNLSFGGIRIANPGGQVNIDGSSSWTLTLGADGIDMTAATQNLRLAPANISFALRIGLAANQSWNVQSGRMVTSGNQNTRGALVTNNGHTLTVDGGGGVYIGSYEGAGGLEVQGGSSLFLRDAALYDYSGGLTVNDGTVAIRGTFNESGEKPLGSGALTLHNATLNLTVGNFDYTHGNNVSMSGNLSLVNSSLTAGNPARNQTFGTLVINGNGTLDVTATGDGKRIIFGSTTLNGNPTFDVGSFAGNGIQLGAVSETGGSRSITKQGEGTLILTAAGTYSGTTRVEAGTLSLTHGSAVADSALIRIDSGATLDVSGLVSAWSVGAAQTLQGKGTVVGNTTVAGTLSPGASPGNITFEDNLTLSGTYDWEYGDLTIVQSLLTLENTWVLNVQEGYGLQDRNDVDGISVALFTYDTRSYNAPASVIGFGGYLVSDVRDDGDGTIWLDNVGWAAIIPEPGTVMLISLGSLIIWFRRRSV